MNRMHLVVGVDSLDSAEEDVHNCPAVSVLVLLAVEAEGRACCSLRRSNRYAVAVAAVHSKRCFGPRASAPLARARHVWRTSSALAVDSHNVSRSSLS